MYIKKKIVTLKNGKLGVYYYVAMSIRVNGKVRPEIIKYVGKRVPIQVIEYVKRKNEEFKMKRKK
ncbi:MAG: hypothetical protein PHY59_07145 [Methanobacterium sp.]|nr:hypothetical protein [Methanobacterium sp.]